MPSLWSACLIGGGLGATFLGLTAFTSAFKAAAVLLGALLCAAILFRPDLGLVAMVGTIPLDRLGRLGANDAVVSFSVAKVLGLVTTAALILHLLRRRQFPRFPIELALLVAFLAWGGVTLIYSTDELATKQAISRLVTTLVFLFVCSNVLTSVGLLRRTLIAFLLTTMGVGLFSLYTRSAGDYVTTEGADLDDVGVMADAAEADRVGEVLSSQGATVHPGFYVLALIVAIPLYLFFVQTSRTAGQRLFWMGGTGIALANLVLTQRRSGVLALGIIALYMLWKRVLRPDRFMAFSFATLALLSLFFVPSTFWERVFSPDAYSDRSHNVKARLELLSAAKEILSEHWLLGVGLYNQTKVLEHTDIVQTERGATVHNAYLQLWIESGIVGLSLFLSLLYCFWRDFALAEKGFRREGNVEMLLLVVFLKASFLGPILLGLTGTDWNMPMRDWWFVCAAGMFVGRMHARGVRPLVAVPDGDPELSAA